MIYSVKRNTKTDNMDPLNNKRLVLVSRKFLILLRAAVWQHECKFGICGEKRSPLNQFDLRFSLDRLGTSTVIKSFVLLLARITWNLKGFAPMLFNLHEILQLAPSISRFLT